MGVDGKMGKSILIVSKDLPPLPGRAVTGAGLRMHGIACGLKQRGHTVKYSISRKRILQESDLPGSLKEFSYTKSTLPAIIEKVSPDYVFKIWWGEEDAALAGSPVPVIIDLPAPRLLEDMFHNRPPFLSLAAKTESFRRGTFFTCPSLLHKAYYLPILMMSGFVEKKGLIEVIPHPVLPEPAPKERREPVFVFGGVFWPWQNPVIALNGVIRALEKSNSGVLRVITGPVPCNDVEKREYLDPVPLLTASRRLSLSSLKPYREMKEEFLKSLVGIDVMQKNIEREISFSFRTLEYLSCGLPVIVGSAGEWARWIKEYDAGWVVDPADPRETEDVVSDILLSPDTTEEKSLNALRLVKEIFAPERAVEPLHKFIEFSDLKKPEKSERDGFIQLQSFEILAKTGFTEEAKAVLSSENRGAYEWLHHRRGLAFMKMKEFYTALDEFRKEESIFPGKAENFRMAGVACRESGNCREAMRLLGQAEKADPLLEWLHLEKGLAYCSSGDIDKAFAEIVKEEELYPGKGETSQAMGMVATRNAEYKLALDFYRKAVTRDRRLLTAEYNLASLLSLVGERGESASLFKKIADNPDSPVSLKAGCCFHLAKIFLERKKNNDAEKYLQTCLKLAPAHKEAKKLLQRSAL